MWIFPEQNCNHPGTARGTIIMRLAPLVLSCVNSLSLAVDTQNDEVKARRRHDDLGDDVRRVLLGEGVLATSLSCSELTWLCRLNRSCRFITYFRAGNTFTQVDPSSQHVRGSAISRGSAIQR